MGACGNRTRGGLSRTEITGWGKRDAADSTPFTEVDGVGKQQEAAAAVGPVVTGTFVDTEDTRGTRTLKLSWTRCCCLW